MEGEMEVNVDKRTHELQHALAHAENIIATLREPFVVLDKSLRVHTANAALPQVLSNSYPVEDFEVEHASPALGRRNMLLNARRFPPDGEDAELILLAIEDDTDPRRAEAAMKDGG